VTETVDEGTPSLLRSGVVVAVASAGGNVAAFALTLGLGRLLSPAEFGAIGALFGLAIVGQVPGFAVQAVVARQVANRRRLDNGGAPLPRALLLAVLGVAVAVAAVGLLLAVPLAAVLHLDASTPTLWLAAALAPSTITFGAQGLLQGAERFGALGLLIVVTAVARVAGGLAGVPGGPAGVLAGIAAGSVVTAAFAAFLVRDIVRGAGSATGERGLPPGAATDWWHAVVGLGALLALTNADVVLARHFLPPETSGLYTAGAVVEKIAFWLPQAVALVVFPRLTDPDARGPLLLKASAAVGALGAATSLGAAVVGPWALGLLLGSDYRTLGPELGLFAAAGAAGALVQLVLYSGIARGSRSIGAALLAALAVLVIVVATVAHGSVTAVVSSVLAVLGTVAIIGLAVSLRPPARRQWPASSQFVPAPTETSSGTDRA
jgi:O-antigen/teichoic acid export membrane protein